jgi:hypothetical protein
MSPTRSPWPSHAGAALLLLALSACSAAPTLSATPSPSATAAPGAPAEPIAGPPDPTPASDGAPVTVQTCDASLAAWAIGQAPDDATVARIVADTHSRTARVVKLGQPMTMDYRQDRVNVMLDASGRIEKLTCG